MSAVIYIRTPDSLKQTLKDYASARGMTETAAAASLLERALAAIGEETAVEKLNRKLEAASRELEKTRAALQRTELELREARQRDEAAAHVYKAVTIRARQPLGECKRCQHPLSGADLYVNGRCPNPECATAITELLTPTRGGLKETEYLPFIGALGGLLGLALDTTRNRAD